MSRSILLAAVNECWANLYGKGISVRSAKISVLSFRITNDHKWQMVPRFLFIREIRGWFPDAFAADKPLPFFAKHFLPYPL